MKIKNLNFLFLIFKSYTILSLSLANSSTKLKAPSIPSIKKPAPLSNLNNFSLVSAKKLANFALDSKAKLNERKHEIKAVFGRGRDNKLLGLSPYIILGATSIVLFPGLFFGAVHILFYVFTLGPLLLILGFNILLRATTITQPCPACGEKLTGPRQGSTQCLSCGASLFAADGSFEVEPSFARKYQYQNSNKQDEFSNSGKIIDVEVIDSIED
mmetsp:Transcript_5621/g.8464  ORF Transcript_5621/g.8464 Transcript_5621/m.8464 type:complete len:214 (+) Transcript_5621:19-660(+)